MPFPCRVEKRNVYGRAKRNGRGRPPHWSKRWERNLILLRLCGLELGEILEIFNILSCGRIPANARRRPEQILQESLSKGYQRYCASNGSLARERIRFLKRLKPRKLKDGKGHKKLQGREQRSSAVNGHLSLALSAGNALKYFPKDGLNCLGRSEPSTSLMQPTSPPSDDSVDQTTYDAFGKSFPSGRLSDTTFYSRTKKAIRTASTTIRSSLRSSRSLKLRRVLAAAGRTPSDISDTMSLLKRLTFQSTTTTATSTSYQDPSGRDASFDITSTRQSIVEGDYTDLHEYIQACKYERGNPNRVVILECCSNSAECFHRMIQVLALLPPQQASDMAPDIINAVDSSQFIHELNHPDAFGNTGMFFAARSGVCIAALLVFLEHVTDVNALNQSGQSLLHVLDVVHQNEACRCCHSERFAVHQSSFMCLVAKLESLDFDFDHIDHDGRSFVSCQIGNPRVALGLIQGLSYRSPAWDLRLGAHVMKLDRFGLPLETYIRHETNRDIRGFFVGEDYEERQSCDKILQKMLTCRPAAFHALDPNVLNYYVKLISQIPIVKAHINNYNVTGDTAFLQFIRMAAEMECDEDARRVSSFWLEEMIAWGANPNLRARDGSTALHIAAKYKRPELVDLLVEADLDINHANDAGYTAVRYAVEAFDWFQSASSTTKSMSAALECVMILVDHGAKMDRLDRIQMGPKWLSEQEKRELSQILGRPLEQI